MLLGQQNQVLEAEFLSLSNRIKPYLNQEPKSASKQKLCS